MCQGTGYIVPTSGIAILGETWGGEERKNHSLQGMRGHMLMRKTSNWLTQRICLKELVFFKCGVAEALGEEATCQGQPTRGNNSPIKLRHPLGG